MQCQWLKRGALPPVQRSTIITPKRRIFAKSCLVLPALRTFINTLHYLYPNSARPPMLDTFINVRSVKVDTSGYCGL